MTNEERREMFRYFGMNASSNTSSRRDGRFNLTLEQFLLFVPLLICSALFVPVSAIDKTTITRRAKAFEIGNLERDEFSKWTELNSANVANIDFQKSGQSQSSSDQNNSDSDFHNLDIDHTNQKKSNIDFQNLNYPNSSLINPQIPNSQNSKPDQSITSSLFSDQSINLTSYFKVDQVTTASSFPARLRFNPSKDPMWTSRLIFASLYGVLFLLGLANVLVLFIVSRYRRMRTVTNIFIFNLCLADLVYISFLPVVIMFQLLRDWMFGNVTCKLFYIVESTAKYASVYFVCVLSLDRYLAMCHPHWCKRYRHPTLALTVSAVGWLITSILMMPIYLYSTVVGPEGYRACTVAWPSQSPPFQVSIGPNHSDFNISDYDFENDTIGVESFFFDLHFNSSNESIAAPPRMHYSAPSIHFYFVTMTFVFCFGIPALVIMFFYFKVIDQLMQASNRAERLRKKREKTYRKVTRMVLAVITCYILCWMPYWIQFLVVTFVNVHLNDALRIFFNAIHLLPYLNCAINPILYSLMTENFRRILIELFPCSICCVCSKCARGDAQDDATRRRLKSPIDYRRRSATLEIYQSQNGIFSKGNNINRKRNRSASCANSPFDDDDDEFEPRRLAYVRESISQSVRLMSDFSLNLLTGHSSLTGPSTETTL